MILLWNFFFLFFSFLVNAQFDIGVGIADVTGPAVQTNMMGYAQVGQIDGGIHTRLWSRAFIFGQGSERVVFVSVDAGMTSQLLKSQVVIKLKEKFGDNLYTDANICLSSTHTHSGPGGFFQDFLYDITSLGFVKETFDAMLNGIVTVNHTNGVGSIVKAHENIQPGFIYSNEGELKDASINRSPASYLENPENERASYESNVDRKMFLLKITDVDGNPLGMINWFAVHGTSMNNTNVLISSDNKGFASLLFEQEMNGKENLPGKGKFVAAFAQSNEGDVSPNTKGAVCINTGKPCDFNTSTCHGSAKYCIASGPGEDMFDSTRIIGEKQFHKAKELWDGATNQLNGPIKFIHQYVNMSAATIQDEDGKFIKSCPPSLGHSFAAGTTDGPGDLDFKQHTVVGKESVLWNILSSFIFNPSDQLKECQHPKPVLITQMRYPTLWMPEIVPLQLLQIGQLLLIGVPGEITTMSGRRLRNAIHKVMEDKITDLKVVIAGLSNSYTNYIATKEEYWFQRYEGASTLYGPNTLEIYTHFFKELAEKMANNETAETEETPRDEMEKLIKYSHVNYFDSSSEGKQFGHVLIDAQQSYNAGDRVKVKFVSSNPRNGIKLQSFVYIEQLKQNEWKIIATDANWQTKFYWKRTNRLKSQSQMTVIWDLAEQTENGQYRIRVEGMSKSFFSKKLNFYEGSTRNFTVTR